MRIVCLAGHGWRPVVVALLAMISTPVFAQPEDPQPEDSWTRFVDALRPASELLHRQRTPQDELTRAEGYRHLARMIRKAIEMSHEYTATDRPVFFDAQTATMLSGGVTSDGRYRQAFIDGGKTYRISGRRGSAALIEFAVYEGRIGSQNTSTRVGLLTEQKLKVKKNGRFEVILSPEKHRGNWIRTTPSADVLLVRQYAHDWNKSKRARLSIERIGEAPAEAPLTEYQIDQDLLEAATFVRRLTTTWAYLLERIGLGPANTMLAIPADLEPIMSGGHKLAMAKFEVPNGQALVVDFKPPRASYWGLQLTNYWLEPLDFGSKGSHLNNKTVNYNKDGSVRVTIAGQDPKVANWLSTKGHVAGTLQFRLARSNNDVPEFQTALVPLSEVRHHVHATGLARIFRERG